MLNFLKKNLSEEQLKQVDKTLEKFKKNPHQFRFTVMFFLTSILFGVLSIYLLQQKFALLMQKNGKVEIKEVIKNVPVPPADVTIKPTEEATNSTAVSDKLNWQLQKNENCNVLVPVSPYKTTADNGELAQWKTYSLAADNDFPTPFLNIFNQIELVGFTESDQPTEAGRMIIYCTDNPDGKAVLDLKNKITTELETNEDLKEITIVSSLEKKLWGKASLELVFSGRNLDGQIFYATATNKHFYLIGKQVTNPDENVKKDLERMFNGIIFLD
ncbi:MAG: hypothetical protein ACOZAK_00900 [Patescibacteria group bacterium]